MVNINLEGQVAVVTGGSRGIGAATVRLLAEAGASVVFSYQRQVAAAEAVAADCGGRALAVQAEMRDPSASEGLVATAIKRFGRLDIAVANAGIWNQDDVPIENLTPEAWNETIEINLSSVYALARAAVTQMKRQPAPPARPPGRIIAIASTAGQRGESFHVHYGASKAGTIGLVRGLAAEVARDGIRVNCVAPGWIETDMSRPVFGVHPERVFSAIPLGQPGQPEHIAGTILFLCTPWSDFMTASVLSVNGGAVVA